MSASGERTAAASDAAAGYDRGWGDATWNAAEPPTLPAPTALQRLGGALRLGLFVLVTLVLLPPFFLARALGGRRDRAVAGLWCAAGAALCGLTIRRVGAPIREGGVLLANHASWLDILVIGASAPVHFVAKAEVAGWPIFGWIGRISNTVFIARKRAAAKAQERLLFERAASGDLLCVFPEGTSSDGLRVLPFKSALFAMFVRGDGAPPAILAQPAAVRYHAPRGLPESFHGWWGRMPLFPHIWSIVCLGRGGRATVTFAPPLVVSAEADRKSLALDAERAVRDAHAAAGENSGGTA